jgi:hypothetical protein
VIGGAADESGRAQAYAAFFKAFYHLTKSSLPNTHLIAGALSSPNATFLAELYKNGIKDYYDALSIDAFSDNDSPPIALFRTPLSTGIEAFHKVMVENGDDKKIWITAFGYSTATVASEQ